jgi:hypothetical protein
MSNYKATIEAEATAYAKGLCKQIVRDRQHVTEAKHRQLKRLIKYLVRAHLG